MLAMGLFFSPSHVHPFEGYYRFILHPSLMDFDGLQQGSHFGTAFLNAGLQLIVVFLVYKWTKTDIHGVQIAAAMMVMGFSFYGKNMVNVWFPFIGVMLYTIAQDKPLKTNTALAWFSTALAPVFSVLAFNKDALGPVSPTAIIMGAAMGILGGVFVAAIASDHLPRLHQGYILFNAGFADGIAGIFIYAILRAMGLGHGRYPYVEIAQALKQGIRADYVSGQNGVLGLTLFILFAYLIIAGIKLGGAGEFKNMIWVRCKGGNFVEKYGIAPCLINMGFMGLVSTAYVFLTFRGQLGGPLYACICTAVGLAASGVTLRMFLPTLAGVSLTAFVTGGIAGFVEGGYFLEGAITNVSSRGMLLAAIFSCGLAPVVGEHGPLAGLFVGVMHAVLVPNTGAFHGWMSLYNNGLSLSLVATFMHPIYSKLHIDDKKAAVIALETET